MKPIVETKKPEPIEETKNTLSVDVNKECSPKSRKKILEALSKFAKLEPKARKSIVREVNDYQPNKMLDR